MKRLGIMNHTQRHFRVSQLADVLDPFELKEALHRETIPVEYAHRAEGRRLAKEDETDRIWSGNSDYSTRSVHYVKSLSRKIQNYVRWVVLGWENQYECAHKSF